VTYLSQLGSQCILKYTQCNSLGWSLCFLCYPFIYIEGPFALIKKVTNGAWRLRVLKYKVPSPGRTTSYRVSRGVELLPIYTWIVCVWYWCVFICMRRPESVVVATPLTGSLTRLGANSFNEKHVIWPSFSHQSLIAHLSKFLPFFSFKFPPWVKTPI